MKSATPTAGREFWKVFTKRRERPDHRAMNRVAASNDGPQNIRRQRRNGSDWASAIVAFCRGTGLTEAACYRILLTLMDVSGGRETFRMDFVRFGRRMARSKSKSDKAYQEMTSRDLAFLEEAEGRTGFYPVTVTRGDKTKRLASEWNFPGLQWIEEIHRLGVEILGREGRKGREQRMNREACFDAAFAEIAESIPRNEPRRR